MLGEAVGRWRIGALIFGAFGAIFILSPWKDDFYVVQILPIVAGFFLRAEYPDHTPRLPQ